MAIFQWLNKQGVESSEGFVLQRMHRHYYHYIEAGKVLKVIVEPCRDHNSGEYYEEISIQSLHAWESPCHTALSSQEQSRFQANIGAALAFMGIRHRFVSSSVA